MAGPGCGDHVDIPACWDDAPGMVSVGMWCYRQPNGQVTAGATAAAGTGLRGRGCFWGEKSVFVSPQNKGARRRVRGIVPEKLAFVVKSNADTFPG